MALAKWWDEHQRLTVALRQTRSAYERDTAGRDLHTGTDIANQWMFIAACYSGLEQSLKVIAAAHLDISVEDVRKSVPRGRGHDLSILFKNLDHEAKCVLMRYYARFQSLHSYIPIGSLPDFLQSISRTDGKGYERWRYSLIETDNDLPTNSAEAMLAIWTSSNQLIGQRLGIEPIVMPEHALMRELGELLPRVSTGDDATQPRWRECYEKPINCAAQMLWDEHRGINTTSSWIQSWIEAIKERSTQSRELRHFIVRATGSGTTGLSICWDDEAKCFANVPWNMQSVVENEAPDGARELYSSAWDARPEVLRRTHQNGFTVRENWESANSLDGRWWRTVVAEKTHGSGVRDVLTAWLHDYDLYVELEGEATDLFRHWEFK
ncbi:MAG: hypothetical protein OXQ31_17875 [Spirochaetaceae bacterium]|nr:hypothetical protein [Spirochaetaceae bacterium]